MSRTASRRDGDLPPHGRIRPDQAALRVRGALQMVGMREEDALDGVVLLPLLAAPGPDRDAQYFVAPAVRPLTKCSVKKA